MFRSVQLVDCFLRATCDIEDVLLVFTKQNKKKERHVLNLSLDCHQVEMFHYVFFLFLLCCFTTAIFHDTRKIQLVEDWRCCFNIYRFWSGSLVILSINVIFQSRFVTMIHSMKRPEFQRDHLNFFFKDQTWIGVSILFLFLFLITLVWNSCWIFFKDAIKSQLTWRWLSST